MTSQNNRIPVCVITGFLGSGKTTLLNRVLNEPHGRRIAVVENEFGEVGIDEDLISAASPTVMKMSNGCLCCTSSGDLVRALAELRDRKNEFDYVIIETTGVANPAPVLQTFALNEEISNAFAVDSVVTLVDAMHVERHLESKECKAQIAMADVVVLNKVDLVESAKIDEVERAITRLNPVAAILKTSRALVDVADIFRQGSTSLERLLQMDSSTGSAFKAEACEHAGHDHGDHDHDHCDHDHCDHEAHHGLSHHYHDEEISSLSCQADGDLDPSLFNPWFGTLLRKHGDDLYRCKGILSLSGRDNKVVLHAVHRVTEVEEGSPWGAEPRKSRLVFIGKSLDRTGLIDGFAACVVR